MAIGTESNDTRFGPRVVRVNVPVRIRFTDGPRDGRYYGEWSEQLKQPHGRGIFIDDDDIIYIRYFMNGTTKVDGKLIFFTND